MSSYLLISIVYAWQLTIWPILESQSLKGHSQVWEALKWRMAILVVSLEGKWCLRKSMRQPSKGGSLFGKVPSCPVAYRMFGLFLKKDVLHLYYLDMFPSAVPESLRCLMYYLRLGDLGVSVTLCHSRCSMNGTSRHCNVLLVSQQSLVFVFDLDNPECS